MWSAGRASVALLSFRLACCQDSTDFEVLPYRSPTQCERMQCLSEMQPLCREHLHGFSLKERGCLNKEQICTNCTHGNSTVAEECRCENLPYARPVGYGDQCDALKDCTGGSMCYRPCYTYLHVTKCPKLHCIWNTRTFTCEDKPPETPKVLWREIGGKGSQKDMGPRIVNNTPSGYFPLGYVEFKAAAKGYSIVNMPLEDSTLESLFISLDDDNDGVLSAKEYGQLPHKLHSLEVEASARMTQNDEEERRRLLSLNGTVNPEICNAQRPPKVYCSFDVSCKLDCSTCGWKSAVDQKFHLCVLPSPAACHDDNDKVYCPSDGTCHAGGDCTTCPDMPIVDYSQHKCMSAWWYETPPAEWMNWICRHRNKVGMKCQHDQDCVYGLRRCLHKKCQPKQPYNENHTCESDYDCPHNGYYCPVDPTGGANPYWVQFCREQRQEGEKCSEDRECAPHLRCNTAEKTSRCRRLFSRAVGQPAIVPELCMFAWTDKHDICAVPAKSKQVGRSCESDMDCLTTDQSGKTGVCKCKAWWDTGDSKYCMPVAGDFKKHSESLRNYLSFKAGKCGTFWTDEECMQQWGDEGLRFWYDFKCEEQKLSRGPYLPPPDCNIEDPERFIDYCKVLNALGAAAPRRPLLVALLAMSFALLWTMQESSSG